MSLLVFVLTILGANAFGTSPIATTTIGRRRPTVLHERPPVKIVFSDVDGSLVHYEKTNDNKDDDSILSLPPSATGMKGVISHETLRLCRDLRKKGVKLVLVSGMRTSTLLNRLPYLPRADAYCSEAGGRIFYPTEPDSENPQQWAPLGFTGCNAELDLELFGLREDRRWRQRMEAAAGSEAYAGNEVFSERCLEGEDDDEECLIDYENPSGFPRQKDVVPVQQRSGALWGFARELQEEGLVLDTKSYSTCFRVNQKHQSETVLEKFQDLLEGDRQHPKELAKSTNLGCIDVYPVSSGKRKCCEYLAKELGIDMAKESVCICDDDNDLEMAQACSQAYVPALTSGSMERAIAENPARFTQTFQNGTIASTKATDAALGLIHERVEAAAEEEEEAPLKSIPVEWKSKKKSPSKRKKTMP